LTRWLPVALAAALAWGATGALAINKCTDKTGKVTYQDKKCPDDVKADELKGLPPPADEAPAAAKGAGTAKSSAEEGDDPADPHMGDLVSVMVGYEGCTKAFPDFAGIHATQYSTWRTANAKYFARLEKSARYQEELENGRKEMLKQPFDSPEFIQGYTNFCNKQFIPMLLRNTPR
jgi:hypothetical protein